MWNLKCASEKFMNVAYRSLVQPLHSCARVSYPTTKPLLHRSGKHLAKYTYIPYNEIAQVVTGMWYRFTEYSDSG